MMEEDKCWACGSEGNHPEWGGHYWPCGTMKSASIRGEICYENELTISRTLVREMAEAAKIVLDNPYYRQGWIERTATLAEILNRPQVKAARAALEGKD